MLLPDMRGRTTSETGCESVVALAIVGACVE